MKSGESEKQAQTEIEDLVNDVFSKLNMLTKVPLIGGGFNIKVARTLGIDKFAAAVMKISQKYVEAKFAEMVGKKYVLKIEESGSEGAGPDND